MSETPERKPPERLSLSREDFQTWLDAWVTEGAEYVLADRYDEAVRQRDELREAAKKALGRCNPKDWDRAGDILRAAIFAATEGAPNAEG